MDGNPRYFSFDSSSTRIAEILDQPSGSFEETDSLPDRDNLTFTNGFYGQCTAVFIDIRDSSGMTARNQRPALAKIYRAFISEMVAVLNSISTVREVNIVGDCVWAVYNTRYIIDINNLFKIIAQANSVVELLNQHLTNRGMEALRVGVGVDYGRALMIKAGFNGSGINDVVYMGDVVNSAAHIAHEAGRSGRSPIFLSPLFWSNLQDDYKAFCTASWVAGIGSVYGASVVDIYGEELAKSLR
ncbi:adenylate/guanylate cyclase domain-containing protein [Frigoribacterium sp. CFBP9039]|uniref:adenylate/guanylate cyclase domain-containing protein n=1 Tax=Frigoribacterium sp. CFBP9029 TaxID=3096541 RepID=UPI002A6B65CC|nr:adenylate/guanylate cyclase domain-containing protein [Frigoribacterium sp. CFBP9039]MDY0945766.1 adenylate/guanylate cyclase domain-containing protein [Frigoribacterium sp. CFBP9039]